MNEYCNVTKFKGTSKEVGISIGRYIGDKFHDNIDKMIETIDKCYGLNYKKLESESMQWFRNIPVEYQKELEGVSIGSGCSINKITKWYYSSMCIDGGCTSFITKYNGSWWVGRNNDYLLPQKWGYINIIKVNNKIPVMLFGLEGDIFSGTGYNKEQLWIHYNWLPVWDIPDQSNEVLDPFIFIRTALESCKTVDEIEDLLKVRLRNGGMNLFVIDGTNNESAVFECTCKKYIKRDIDNSYIAGANHYCDIQVPNDFNHDFGNSLNRQLRVEELLSNRKENLSKESMIDILADPGVEQNNGSTGTVYANIACPSKSLIMFAYDGFPAASKSKWRKAKWNW